MPELAEPELAVQFADSKEPCPEVPRSVVLKIIFCRKLMFPEFLRCSLANRGQQLSPMALGRKFCCNREIALGGLEEDITLISMLTRNQSSLQRQKGADSV